MRDKLQRFCSFWLESLLLIAVASLILQLYPRLLYRTVSLLDVTRWSGTTRIAVNLGVLLTLVAVRYRTELVAAMTLKGRLGAQQARIPGGDGSSEHDLKTTTEYQERAKRDAEWRERAKKRLPHS